MHNALCPFDFLSVFASAQQEALNVAAHSSCASETL